MAVLIGFGLLIAVIAAVSLRQTAAPNYLEQALAAQQRGDAEGVIAALKAHLQVAPDSTSTRLRLAGLLREKQPEEALAVLAPIPATDPQSTAALQQIAVIHLLANRREEAAAALEAIVKAEPQNFGAQLSLAELYFQQKEFETALPHALEAARLEPNRAETFLLLADIYDELHNHTAMIDPLQSALKINPSLYPAHLNLAYVHHRLGELPQAGEHARWCLEKNPREVPALRILASIARNEGRFDEADEWLGKALKLKPDDVDSRILEADLLLYRRESRQAYERLKELYPAQQRTVRFLGALARAAAAAGERDEARKLYRAADELVQKSRDGTP